MCIGSCSVRRRSRGTILLLDGLLTEQDPIHRLYKGKVEQRYKCGEKTWSILIHWLMRAIGQ